MRFEFLPAVGGDCCLIHGGTEDRPILILVDGGPRGSYERHLRPRLLALREERGMDEPLTLDLVIVSHAQERYSSGVLDLLHEIREALLGNRQSPFRVRELWHNGPDDIFGRGWANASESLVAFSKDGDHDDPGTDALRFLESLSPARSVRDLARALDIPVNQGFEGMVRTGGTPRTFGGIKITIVGPLAPVLARYEEQRAAAEESSRQWLLESFADPAVANLAGIVLLLEHDGGKALLIGDTRSDFVLRGLGEAGLITGGSSLEVDLIKMPHQGSDRHVDNDFLKQVTAPRYVFTGDGTSGNPERETFRMLAETRSGAAMQFLLSYPVDEIDRRRRSAYERDREKAVKQAGRTKVSRGVPPPWSDTEHSLAAFFATLPTNIEVIAAARGGTSLGLERPRAPGPAPAQEQIPTDALKERNDPVETYTEFVSDDAEVEVDALDRSVLAISLARQLHRIWRKTNGLDRPASAPPSGRDGGAFVLHLDAPWGGGKTTFAHFVSRVLNPYGGPSQKPPSFLTERYGEDFNLGKLFIEPEFGPESRRPWITVWFNAWQAEDCRPPWWVFYQAIREGCFNAIKSEGDEPLDLARPGTPLPQPDWERGYKWRRLIRAEYWWRLGDPKIVTPLAAALVSIALAVILWSVGAIAAGANGLSFAVGNGLGFVLAAVTGLGALWGIGTFVTESVAPGTNSLAERLSLGSADPFERFRDHFARTMEMVGRPVMVVVDDLDRCKPEFIVDLMRGIQILLRSPRVVFVILGDRDWIERAFEKHHEALSKVNVGPEQSLGARFVEKTIQMSFILPGMSRVREAYVRRILGSAPAGAAPQPEKAAPELVVKVRDAVKRAAAEDSQATLDSELLRDKALEAVSQNVGAQDADQAPADAPEETLVRQLIDEEVAIHVSADESAERETIHLLQQLAPFFPPNPRQIKRIVNAMTTYRAMAMHIWSKEQSSELLDPVRLTQMAIWITLMTEWPETWRLLASCPQLADAIADAEGFEKRIKALPASSLPGSVEATIREVRRLRDDAALKGLITGEGRKGAKLDSAAIRDLFDLTPLYRGLRRLADPEAAPAAAPRPAASRSGAKRRPTRTR